MRSPDRMPSKPRSASGLGAERFRALRPGGALVLVLALLTFGCRTTSDGTLRPIETREPGGFTITEEARLGVADRGRFDAAIAAIEEGRPEVGIDALEALVAEAPEVATLHVDLGIAYQLVEDFESAEAALRSALDLHPAHAVALNELGIVLRRTGRFDEARKAYETVLRRHPGFHHARKNLAILCDLYLGDLECALGHYRRYREAVPRDETVAIWIADVENRVQQGAN